MVFGVSKQEIFYPGDLPDLVANFVCHEIHKNPSFDNETKTKKN